MNPVEVAGLAFAVGLLSIALSCLLVLRVHTLAAREARETAEAQTLWGDTVPHGLES